jgi:hypothetical protein
VDLEYQLRIRNAANSADVLTITSVRGGSNPYITAPPTGDAETIDPREPRDSFFGVYSIRAADVDIGGSLRLITSQLEDASGRQQLGFRVAIIEYRENGGAWQVMIAGLILKLRLVSDIEWEFTVGDPMHAHTVTQMFSPSSSTLITAFLTSWPMRGCVLGGPVKGATSGAFGIADLGGWQMRVETTGIATEYYLRPVSIYGPPGWKAGQKDQAELEQIAAAINDAVGAVQIPLSNSEASPWTTIENAEENAWSWRGLTLLIDGVPWKPLAYTYDQFLDPAGYVIVAPRLVNAGYHGQNGIKVKSDGVKTLTNGQLVRVRALTILPSELSPIYLVDHPVELLKTFWDSVGLGYDSTQATALKELIGTDARYAMRITAAKNLADLVGEVCSVYGIGLRGNDSGQIYVFDARLGRSSTAPAVTINAVDVVKDSVQPFDLDPAEAIKSITFRAKRFTDQRMVPVRRGDASIVDGVAETDVELTVVNGATGALPYGDLSMTFGGMILGASALYPTVRDFFIAIAQRLFDRWGWGGIGAKMLMRRGGAGDSVRVGDEILVNLADIPNQNYRLGDNGAIAARAMQIVRRTVTPEGYDVELVDSGLTGQPPATLPAVSAAASADLPRTVATATVTNAAALNAAGYGATLQMAFAATATRFHDVISWPAGQIPTTAFRLPPVVAGTTVYVRARSEQAGHRPTNWGASANVALTGISAPSAFSATPVGADGSKCSLAWTVGSSTDLVDVFIRLSGETFSQAVKVDTLPPGSNRYDLANLTPGTNYIATVQHRDPKTPDVSASVDAAFTSSGTTLALNAPTDPSPFAFAPSTSRLLGQNSLPAGIYGLGVVAKHVPGEIEIAEAVETAVGSGLYGGFTTVGRIPAVSGNWTLWQNVAPNDGLRRQLKARSVRDGTTASSYSAIVVATPWTYQALAPYPGDALLELTITPVAPSASDRLAFRLTPRDPLPTGSADLSLSFSIEAGLTVYTYGTTTPAATVNVASGSSNDYEAVRPNAGDGPKTVSAALTKTGRTTGKSAIVVVPEQPYTVSGVPSIDNIAAGAATTPCDGGGDFTLVLAVSNMPTGVTYDLTWTVVVGTYAPATGTQSGVSNGTVITPVPLCSGDTVRATVTATIDGVQIAASSMEFNV